MRTPRILCEELSSPSIQYTNIKQIHHLAKVLRVKPGDSVQLFDGKGNVAAAKINELSKQSIHFLIDEVYAEKNPYRMNYQAIFPYIKKDNLIFLIQKLTEIGINSMVIFKPDHIDQSLVKKADQLKVKKVQCTTYIFRWHSLQIPMQVINQPMDLKTIGSRVKKGYYHCVDAFVDDLRLMLANTIQRNNVDPARPVLSKRVYEIMKLPSCQLWQLCSA